MLKTLLKIVVCFMLVCSAFANEIASKIKLEVKNNRLGVIFMGDTGSINSDRDKVAAAIEKFCTTEDCNIGLLLGDNFYETGVSSINDPQFKTKFEDPYKNLPFKFYPALGNHDEFGNWQAQIDYASKHWQMGGRFYTLDSELVRFFVLDSNLYRLHDTPQDSLIQRSQQNWLSTELQNTKAIWKIVYGHHPVYSSGMHGDEHKLVLYVEPLLIKNKVDFYLSGHDHDKELIEKNNISYIVLGTGSRLRPIKKGKDSLFAKSSFGFGHLLLTPDAAVLKIVDENGAVEFEKVYTK
jgi:acid phosphatase